MISVFQHIQKILGLICDGSS